MWATVWSFLRLVIPCCLAVPTFAGDDAGRPTEDRRSPEGTWVSICLVAGGHPSCDYSSMVAIAIREAIEEERIGAKLGWRWQFAGELSELRLDSVWDTDKDPMWLDFHSLVRDSRRNRTVVSPGVYRFEGDLLVRASPRPAEDEPFDFTSSKQNGRSLQIHRRATSSDDDIARHIRSDFPANSPMPEHWQIILEVDNGVAIAPTGRTARIGGDQLLSGGTPLRGFQVPPEEGQMIAYAYGALLFGTNPAWLDEVAVQGDRLVARTGIAKREGHCLLWVVSSSWHPARGEWTDYDDRPTRFSAAEGEAQILHVLYPVLEDHKNQNKGNAQKNRR